jgi:hypothetical protein
MCLCEYVLGCWGIMLDGVIGNIPYNKNILQITMRAIVVRAGDFHSFSSNTVFIRRSRGIFDNGKRLKNTLKKTNNKRRFTLWL